MIEKILEKFSDRLSELMKDYGDTTYSLSKYLDMNPSSISKYKTGVSTPKMLTIRVISEKYNVNPMWLMGYDVDKFTMENDIGKKIKAARLNANLTLNELSKIIGISESNMQKHESGQVKNYSIDRINIIAKALNVNID